MAKLKGLGRGLDALLGGMGDQPPAEDRLQTLDIDMLQPGRYQPRTRMDSASLAELAESIKAQGIMQPILVRPLPNSQYEIIAGERRWRGASLAGLTEVPVLIREVPDEAALAMALIENIQRENLNPLEEASGIRRLVDEFAMTHDTAAAAVGRSRSAVSNLLRLLNLPQPVQDLVMEGKLDMGHARALLGLPRAQQIETGNLVAARQLSVRDTEQLVQRLLNPPAEKAPQKIDRDVLRLEEDISDKLGAKVTIRANRKGSGKLTIEFGSNDQLEDILQRFS